MEIIFHSHANKTHFHKKGIYNVDSVTETSIEYNWLQGIMTQRRCVGITETDTDPRLLWF